MMKLLPLMMKLMPVNLRLFGLIMNLWTLKKNKINVNWWSLAPNHGQQASPIWSEARLFRPNSFLWYSLAGRQLLGKSASSSVTPAPPPATQVCSAQQRPGTPVCQMALFGLHYRISPLCSRGCLWCFGCSQNSLRWEGKGLSQQEGSWL